MKGKPAGSSDPRSRSEKHILSRRFLSAGETTPPPAAVLPHPFQLQCALRTPELSGACPLQPRLRCTKSECSPSCLTWGTPGDSCEGGPLGIQFPPQTQDRLDFEHADIWSKTCPCLGLPAEHHQTRCLLSVAAWPWPSECQNSGGNIPGARFPSLATRWRRVGTKASAIRGHPTGLGPGPQQH